MERVDIRDSFGAAYIGSMVTLTLYGITSLQTFLYFIRYTKDGSLMRSFIWAVWGLDTLHVALVCHAMYYYLILNYAFPAALDTGIWSLYVSIGVNVLIAFLTQCFFAKRVHALSGGKKWLTALIALVVLAHFCFGMETMIELILKKKFSRLPEITLDAAMPFAITAVLSDICITVALCVLLYNSRTGFRTTNKVLNYLMMYAINRCLLTSVVAVVEVIMFAIMPHAFWFLGIDFVIGKLYANSLLATLNARSILRGKGLDTELASSSSSSGVSGSASDGRGGVDETRASRITFGFASTPVTHSSRLSTTESNGNNDHDYSFKGGETKVERTQEPLRNSL